ncbi:COR domain-containing protein [Marinomonas balearica]|uniref:TIR domain-containing protein n=1 Tax=Marinomonas balearica TaxID=491947 RepID=A0A4V6PTT5_9GAMM|nr:COR domain-containing protein [Marinomonas balearica]TDO96732.1 TIR domain-containing protein [Marinomonas balearica]
MRSVHLITALTYLGLSGCDSLQSLSPKNTKDFLLESPRLSIHGNLPVEQITKELTQSFDQYAVENWYHDIATQGHSAVKSLKVMLLGNGRIGKTQLARRLRNEQFDEKVPSTQGIQLHTIDCTSLLDRPELSIQTWDFGGQDVYLSTHNLFIDKRAVYLLLWHPDTENTEQVTCEQILIRNKPLSYWLAYLRSLVGKDANILLCQAQCDTPDLDCQAPIPFPNPFTRLQSTPTSAKTDEGLETFLPLFKRRLDYQIQQNGDVWLPNGWIAVIDKLSDLREGGTKQIAFSEFETLCKDDKISVPLSLANYLHQSGSVFFKQGHFNNGIILDQEWALQGVYLLLDRKEALPDLKDRNGEFSASTLERLLWKDNQAKQDHSLFLDMMQQCDVCFEIDEDRYIAPDALPNKSDITNQINAIWQDAESEIELEIRYDFLHDATQRSILSNIGSNAKKGACYWRYGCCYYDSEHKVKVALECHEVPESGYTQEDIDNFRRPGLVKISITGEHAQKYLKHLTESIIESHHFGNKPEVKWVKGHISEERSDTDFKLRANSNEEPFSQIGLAAEPPKTKPSVYFSYAWGSAGEEHQDICDEIYQKIDSDPALDVHRDKNSMNQGDSIDAFERYIARADFIVLLVSHKSLYSSHCMKELAHMYHQCQRQQNEFISKVIPVILSDAKIDTLKERLTLAKHWKNEFDETNELIMQLEALSSGKESVSELEELKLIQTSCANVTAWLSDLVTERQADLQVDKTIQLLERRIKEANKT